MCMCACMQGKVSVHVFLCMYDRDIPAAETWEGVTYETLDSALSGDWGVLKCQNSNFLQTVTPSHTLWPSASLSHSQTHSAAFILVLKSLLFPPPLSFGYKHCLSFSLSSIHKVPQGEILSHTTVLPPPPLLLFIKLNTHSFSSHWASRQSKAVRKGIEWEREEGRVWESRAPPTFRRCSSPSLNCGPMRVAHSQLMRSFYNR